MFPAETWTRRIPAHLARLRRRNRLTAQAARRDGVSALRSAGPERGEGVVSRGRRDRRIIVDGQVYRWQVRGGLSDLCCPYCPEPEPITLAVFHDRRLLFTRSLGDLWSVTPSVVCEHVREFVVTTGFVPAPATSQASETWPRRRRPHQLRRPRREP
jgi:hypothetical protein